MTSKGELWGVKNFYCRPCPPKTRCQIPRIFAIFVVCLPSTNSENWTKWSPTVFNIFGKMSFFGHRVVSRYLTTQYCLPLRLEGVGIGGHRDPTGIQGPPKFEGLQVPP